MAGLTKEQRARKNTMVALIESVKNNGLVEKYYLDQVDEYMKYYDDLVKLNEDLESSLDIDILKEKRQVTKEMRNILAFLGLKPENLGGAMGGGGFEEL